MTNITSASLTDNLPLDTEVNPAERLPTDEKHSQTPQHLGHKLPDATTRKRLVIITVTTELHEYVLGRRFDDASKTLRSGTIDEIETREDDMIQFVATYSDRAQFDAELLALVIPDVTIDGFLWEGYLSKGQCDEY